MKRRVDVVVVGSGPSGREAATTAAAAGRSVLVIEQEPTLGGACVKWGTIPSKALRETAVALQRARRLGATPTRDDKLSALRSHLDAVLADYEARERALCDDAGIEVCHGRASFVAPHELRIRGLRGVTQDVSATTVVVASGSRPRVPAGIDIDHEAIVDSDSLLSFAYLPASLVVLGGGVIASEYASIFASLGVRVTMVDRAVRPLGFLDADLSAAFLARFRAASGTYLGGKRPLRASSRELGALVELEGGQTVEAERVLVALGRVANVEALDLARAGLSVNERGFVPVGPHGESVVPGVYVVGDAAGPPSLAASGVEQGRRAIHHALGIVERIELGIVPTGVYTIPELGAVGATEAEARAAHGAVRVSRVGLARTARGLIAGNDGFLKMIADARGERLLGVHAAGDGATELVSIGQVAMTAGLTVSELGRCVFNFPTLGEAYRVAAREIAASSGRSARPSVRPVSVDQPAKIETPNVTPG